MLGQRGPCSVSDPLLDPVLDEDGELGCGPADAIAELWGAPVLRRREYGGRQRQRAHVGEQRSHLLVDHERVPAAAGGRGKEHGLGEPRGCGA